jgi:chemotaxis protein CheZ
MPNSHRQPADKIMQYLRETQEGEPSFANAVMLAKIVAESMQGFFNTLDSAVYQELQSIADYIETMKQEIGNFQANDLRESRIPAAGMELDAVVQSTETATNTIMEAAEKLLAADHDNLDDYRAFVTDQVMTIFEACSFQDITGQRVGKVVETLQMIENRVGRFAQAVKSTDTPAATMTEDEKARDKRKAELILNGPQLDGKGVDQSKVDDLMKGVAQEDIDALFK